MGHSSKKAALLSRGMRRPAVATAAAAAVLLACGGAAVVFLSNRQSVQMRPAVASSLSPPADAAAVGAWSSGGSGDGRPPPPPGTRDWLEGCRYLYIDFGSNVGIQVRKLFEPDRYPKAEMRPIFDEAFGADRLTAHPHELCAVGFEPNPAHTEALRKLQAVYKKRKWRVYFFTGTAASTVDGETDFYIDGEAPERYRMPGSSLVPWAPEHERVRVATVDLARYLLEEVATRRFDAGGDGADRPPPAVLMKVDVEGFEHQLLPHLIVTGALCKTPVHQVFLEPHAWGDWRSSGGVDSLQFIDFFSEFIAGQRANGTAAASSCPVRILEIDDETYDTSSFPLPEVPEEEEEEEAEREATSE